MELRTEYLRLSNLVGQDDDTLLLAIQALKRIVASDKSVRLSEEKKLARKRERLAVLRQQKLEKLFQKGFNVRQEDLSVSPRIHEIVANMPHLASDFDYKKAIAEMAAEGIV